MTKIQTSVSINELSSSKVIEIVESSLNVKTDISNIETSVECWNYQETADNKLSLKNIIVNISVDDSEEVEITIDTGNKTFNDDFEIEDFVDEFLPTIFN